MKLHGVSSGSAKGPSTGEWADRKEGTVTTNQIYTMRARYTTSGPSECHWEAERPGNLRERSIGDGSRAALPVQSLPFRRYDKQCVSRLFPVIRPRLTLSVLIEPNHPALLRSAPGHLPRCGHRVAKWHRLGSFGRRTITSWVKVRRILPGRPPFHNSPVRPAPP